MTTKRTLVVSGLPDSLTEDNLYDLFDLYGCIADVQLRTDAITGEPLGEGEVIFENEECALEALLAVDGLELLGHSLRVIPALAEGEFPEPSGDGELEFVAEISRPLWDRSAKPAVS